MIARKIIYTGNIDESTLAAIYDVTRKTEITGEVRKKSASEVELNLEGDPSMIKLIQHQIERRVKDSIKDKTVSQIPFQYFVGVTFFS